MEGSGGQMAVGLARLSTAAAAGPESTAACGPARYVPHLTVAHPHPPRRPDPKRGHWMTCHHVGEELVWEVAVPIPAVPELTYKYAVVDEQLEVAKWESETHTIALPEGLEAGAIIDIFDTWQARTRPAGLLHAGEWGVGRAHHARQCLPGLSSKLPGAGAANPWPGAALQFVGWCRGAHVAASQRILRSTLCRHPQDASHPANVLSRSAFSRVILSNKPPPPAGKVLHMKPTINEAIVRFQIWWGKGVGGGRGGVLGGRWATWCTVGQLTVAPPRQHGEAGCCVCSATLPTCLDSLPAPAAPATGSPG